MIPEHLNAIRAACDLIEADPSPENIAAQTPTLSFCADALEQIAADARHKREARALTDEVLGVIADICRVDAQRLSWTRSH